MDDFRWWPVPLVFAGALPVMSFPFAFAPGWANGWPGGLTVHEVWSAGMTAVVSLVLFATAAGAGAAVCSRLVGRVNSKNLILFYGAWLVSAALAAGAVGVVAFWVIYASALQEF